MSRYNPRYRNTRKETRPLVGAGANIGPMYAGNMTMLARAVIGLAVLGAVVVGLILGSIAFSNTGASGVIENMSIITEMLKSYSVMVGNDTMITDSNVTTTSVITEQVLTGEIQYDPCIHMVDGEILPDCTIQYLDTMGLSMTLPADLTPYRNKVFHIYSVIDEAEHMIEIAAGGSSWDKYHEFPVLMIESTASSGVSFTVLNNDDISLNSANGALKCRTMNKDTCVPIDREPYTFAVVTPDAGSPEGAFTWPSSTGEAQFHSNSKRNNAEAIPQLPIFPAPTTGGTFPPEAAVSFSTISEALSPLTGKVVFNTTIFVNPGIYEENILVDGFYSKISYSGSSVEEQPRLLTSQGLKIVGDPRIFAGATYGDCIEFSGDVDNIFLVDGEQIFGESPNAVQPVGLDTVSFIRCDLLSDNTIDKSSCDPGTGPKLNETGYAPGDRVKIYDANNDEFHILNIVSITADNVQFNLTDSSISDIADIFPATDATTTCGSTITFLPNREIRTTGFDLGDRGEIGTTAGVTLNQDVIMYGFYITFDGPEDGIETLVAASATVKARNMVLDPTGIDLGTETDIRAEALAIYGQGHVHDDLYMSEILRNGTVPPPIGTSNIRPGPYPFIIFASTQDAPRSPVIVRGSSSQLSVAAIHIIGSYDEAKIRLQGGTAIIHRRLVSVGSGTIFEFAEPSIAGVFELIMLRSGLATLSETGFGGSTLRIETLYAGFSSVLLSQPNGMRIEIDRLDTIQTPAPSVLDTNAAATIATGYIAVGSPQVLSMVANSPSKYSGIQYYVKNVARYATPVYTSGVTDFDGVAATVSLARVTPAKLNFDCTDFGENAFIGKTFLIRAATAQAHTITFSGCGFDFGGTIGAVGTFGGAIGDFIWFTVYDSSTIIVHDSLNVT